MVGGLTDLSVKVLNTNLVHTRTKVHSTKTRVPPTHTQFERIVPSPESVALILLTVACLNIGLKRDGANSLYEDNKLAGRRGQMFPEMTSEASSWS